MNCHRAFTGHKLRYALSAFALALTLNFLLAYGYRALLGKTDTWLWLYSILCASLVTTAAHRRWQQKRHTP